MNTYKKKPVHVQAGQWFKQGDHSEVKTGPMKVKQFVIDLATMGKVPVAELDVPIAPENGWIDTLENVHEVTPGDYIIRGVKGEFYPCKPDIFEQTYELVDVSDA